jgi:hypothetical protein
VIERRQQDRLQPANGPKSQIMRKRRKKKEKKKTASVLSTGRKTCTSATLSNTNPNRNRASAVRG